MRPATCRPRPDGHWVSFLSVTLRLYHSRRGGAGRGACDALSTHGRFCELCMDDGAVSACRATEIGKSDDRMRTMRGPRQGYDNEGGGGTGRGDPRAHVRRVSQSELRARLEAERRTPRARPGGRGVCVRGTGCTAV